MKKPGEFKETRKKHQAIEKNRLILKKLLDLRKRLESDPEDQINLEYNKSKYLTLSEQVEKGFAFEILAFTENGLCLATVIPEFPKENDVCLCLFGKGEGRKLRVMMLMSKELQTSKNGSRVSTLFHYGTIPSKNIFGVVIDTKQLEFVEYKKDILRDE